MDQQSLNKQEAKNVGIVALSLIVFIIIAIISMDKPGAHSMEWEWSIEESQGINHDTIEQIIAIFETHAPAMSRYADDIEWGAVDIHYPIEGLLNYRQEAFGWTTEIHIRVKIADDARTPSDWQAQGHVLHYRLGAGREPGILAHKPQSHVFMGLEPNRDHDVFVSIPELAIVDTL